MKTLAGILAMLTFTGLTLPPVLGQDGGAGGANGNAAGGAPAAGGTGGGATLTKSTDLDSIRLSVSRGVIDFINNSKRAIINLEWELLPADQTLLKAAAAQSISPVTITIPNNHLGDPKQWSGNAGKFGPMLMDALMGGADLGSFNQSQSDTAFKTYWLDSAGEGRKIVDQGSVRASDYFGLLRDHLQLTGLLASKGIAYTVNVTGATPRGKLPITSDGGDITWQIDVYKFTASKTPQVHYYRFVVTAIVKPISLLFPNTTVAQANLDVGITFRQSDATIGVLEPNLRALPDNLTVDLSPATNETLTKLADRHAESDLQTGLKFIGNGADLGDIVTRGLLGGTTDASVVGGGLIGKGKLSQVVGVNQEVSHFGTDGAVGFLLGVAPGGDQSLFVGPSLRYSVLTLAAGLHAYEKPNATSTDTITATQFAGFVSVDLSRLTGSKKTVTKIQLDNSTSGGDWGVASDLIARDLVLGDWTLKGPDPSLSFSLVQIADRQGNPISDPAKQARITLTVAQQPEKQLRFIPRGTYKYDGIPDNCELRDSPLSPPIANGATVPITSDTVIKIDWSLKHK